MTLAKPLGATAFAAALAVGAAVLSGLAPGRTADPPAPPPVRRGVACTGYVEADGGLIHLTPARPGRVESVAVREGDAVAAGATLLRLDDRDARSAVDQADAAMRAAEARLAQADEAVRLRPAQLDALRATAEAADGRAGRA